MEKTHLWRSYPLLRGMTFSLCLAWTTAEAELVADWTADTYVTGQNWTSNTGGIVATPTGAPTAVAAGFHTHKAVDLDGSSFFTVEAANNPLANATQFTLVAVFETSSTGATGGGWYQSSGLVGMEQANSVADWGLGWNNDRVSAGVGGPDVTMFSPPVSYPQATVAMFTWSGGVQRLYVNGVLVDSDYFVATAARNPGKFAIGAMTEGGGTPFFGRLAEVRLYNTDESTNAATIYSGLRASYFGSLQLVSKKLTTTGGNFVLEDTPGATADAAGTFGVTVGSSIPPEDVSVVKNGTTTTVSFTGTFDPATEYFADVVAPRTVGGEQFFYGRAFTPLLPASVPGLAGAVGSWGISESAGAPGDIAAALTIITGPTPPTPVTGTSPVFNHRDPDTNGLGTIGNFNNDFPILSNTAADDNFVVVGKTQITVAAPGIYTFSVHSDDGFAMRITGAGGGRFISTGGDAQIDLGDNQMLYRNVGGADSNSRGVYQFDAAGTYNIEYLGWDGGAGGYYEVAWAPGGFSEDRNTNTWALVGSPNDPSVPPYQERYVTNLPGPVGTTGAFGTRTYMNAGTIGNLTNASDFLKTTTRTPADPGDGLTIDAQLPYLNHRDPQDGGGGGLIPGDLPIPGNTQENEANVVTVAKGRITIPATSTYTFSYAGDDGFLLRIKGVGGNPDPAFKRATGFGTFHMSDPNELFYDPNGAIDTRGIIDLAAGQYDLEFIQFEGGGAFFYELTAAEGSWPNQTTPPGGFQLVGFVPPAATVVIPGIAEPGWSVETGTPNTGAYGSNIAGAELRIDNTPVEIRTSVWDTLNFEDPQGGGAGSFTPTNPFPLNTTEADDNYSMRATGILNVTQAGDYHLGFQGDDGGYMYIYGHNGTTDPVISSIVSTNVPAVAAIGVAPGSSVNNAIRADTGTGNSRTIVSVPLAVGQYRIQTLVFEGVGGSWWEVIGAKGPLDPSFNIPLLAKGPGTTVNLANGLALVEQPPVVPEDPTFRITGVSVVGNPVTSINFNFGSQDGATYTVEGSVDLVDWIDVATNLPATGASTPVSVNLADFPELSGQTKVFLRVVLNE